MATFKITDPTKSRKLTVTAMKARDYLRWSVLDSKSMGEIRAKFFGRALNSIQLNQFSMRHMCRIIEAPETPGRMELWHYTPEGDPKRILLIVELIPEEIA